MKKVLILSYYFPPCNLTAAQRIGGWEKYLPEFGFYPIVVTRNWTGEELTEVQRLQNSGTEIRHVQKEQSEIFYTPYHATLRDRCFEKGQTNRLYKLFSKFLTILTIFFRHFSLHVIPFKNLYDQASDILSKNPDIQHVIISADPFEQFSFGYHLKKRFPRINWIADYRDDWTTSDIDYHPFRKLQAYYEKKWINSSAKVISVSPLYTSKISELTKKTGETIYNGFDSPLNESAATNHDVFTITYNGTLYESQPIELFLVGLQKLINSKPKIKIIINFPGLAINPNQEARVRKIMEGYEHVLNISNRLPKEQVIEMQNSSDFLLMVAHQNIKGIPSSKVFEYIGLRKPFILCPGDDDILNKISNDSKIGTILSDSDQVFIFLQNALCNKLDKQESSEIDEKAILQFSVKAQVKNLGAILDKLS
jgi:glycosyltransferase involved in cell wall biosynthesis